MKSEKPALTEHKIIKQALICFIRTFAVIFFLLIVNQVILILKAPVEKKFSFSGIIFLLFYSLPPVFVLSTPFAVCISLVQTFSKTSVAAGFSGMVKKNIRKKIFCTAIVFSVLNLVISGYILPAANSSFADFYIPASGKHPDPEKKPQYMSSRIILQEIKLIKNGAFTNYKKTANRYIMEIHKRFAIPLGTLFFAFFALSLSAILKKPVPGLCVSSAACILYWVMFIYGQVLSIHIARFGILIMWLPNLALLGASLALRQIATKQKNKEG